MLQRFQKSPGLQEFTWRQQIYTERNNNRRDVKENDNHDISLECSLSGKLEQQEVNMKEYNELITINY